MEHKPQFEGEQRSDMVQEKINWHKMKIIKASAEIEYHQKELKRLQPHALS